MSYSAHQLNWVLGWPAVASGYPALKQIASVLQTASFARLPSGAFERADDQCRCEVRAARLRTTSIAAARLLARSPQTSIPQVLLSSPRVDAAKREALAGRRYVITETG